MPIKLDIKILTGLINDGSYTVDLLDLTVSELKTIKRMYKSGTIASRCTEVTFTANNK
jgi:hypothetical protein